MLVFRIFVYLCSLFALDCRFFSCFDWRFDFVSICEFGVGIRRDLTLFAGFEGCFGFVSLDTLNLLFNLLVD